MLWEITNDYTTNGEVKGGKTRNEKREVLYFHRLRSKKEAFVSVWGEKLGKKKKPGKARGPRKPKGRGCSFPGKETGGNALQT